MDIRELKEVLKNSTSVLILENGEPAFIVLNYQTYKNALKNGESAEVRVSNEPNNQHHPVNPLKLSAEDKSSDVELLERLNREIMMLKQQIELEEQRKDSLF